MEHTEEAGVHSGDSACAIPPPTLAVDVVHTIERYTRALAEELEVVGLLNVQFAVKDRRVYVIEANPRASRTVPFVSKATGVPLAKVAARVMLGATFEELSAEGLLRPPAAGRHVAVKEAVLPFNRFPEVDTFLGPEMRSTGEVMGIDRTFGLAFAKQNPQAEITAVDWPNVLVVAKENAQFFGASDRYHTIPGSAFDVDYGTDYDIVLLTNFLHHFDPPTCEALLRKIHAALKDGGRAVTLEFVPNEDRVTPPQAAAFSMMMLGATPAGDAYTFSEFEEMFRKAGFTRSELHELPPTIERVVVSYK